MADGVAVLKQLAHRETLDSVKQHRSAALARYMGRRSRGGHLQPGRNTPKICRKE